MANEVIIHVKGRDDASKVLGGVEKKAGGLGAALKNVTQIAGGFMLAQGIMKAPQIIGGLMSSASELELQMKKANIVFGDQIGVVKAWADTNAASMGLTKRAAINAAAGFADLLIPMGFTREMATGMATDVVGLSGALAEWSGGKYQAADVSAILAKAMLGEREGLKALGISITEAEVKGKLLEKGQQDLTGEMLQQAKALATQELVFEKSTDAQTAYAEGAGSAARKQAELKAKIGEVKEEIALKLAPAFTKLLDIIVTQGLPAFEKLKTLIGRHVVPVLKELVVKLQQDVLPVLKEVVARFQQDVIPAMQKLARDIIQRYLIPALDTLADLWKNLQSPLREVWSLIQSKVLPVFEKVGGFLLEHKPLLVALAAAILLLVAPWVAVVAAIVLVLAKWDEISQFFTKDIPAAIDSFLDKFGEIPIIGEIFDGAFKAVKVIVETYFGLVKTYIETVINSIRAIIQIVTSLIKGDWEGAWQGIKDLVTGIWEGIYASIKLALDAIKALLGIYAETFLGVIKDGWELVKGFFLTTIPDFFKNNWKDILLVIFAGIPGLLIYKFRDQIWAKVQEVAGDLLSAGESVGKSILTGIVDGMKGLGAELIKTFKDAWNAAVQWMDANFKIHIPGPSAFGVSLPDFDWNPDLSLLKLARGGIVTRPTLALLGEHGKEAVIPLGQGTVPGGGTYINEIHMHVQGSILSERDVEKVIGDALRHGKFRGAGGIA